MSKNNGNKRRKKTGRPKASEQVNNNLIKSKAIEHDGSPTAVANALGISPATACKRIKNNKDIQQTLQRIRAKCLRKSGASLLKTYKRVAEGLDATKTISANVIAPDGEGMADAHSMTKDFIDVPDFKERRESSKLCLQLHGHLNDDKDKDKDSLAPPVMMPLILINNQTINYDFVGSP